MKKGDLIIEIQIKKKIESSQKQMYIELGKGVGYYHALQLTRELIGMMKNPAVDFEEVYPESDAKISGTPLFKTRLESDGENHFLDSSVLHCFRRVDQKLSSFKTMLNDLQIALTRRVLLPNAKKAIKASGNIPTQNRIVEYFDKEVEKYIHNRTPFVRPPGADSDTNTTRTFNVM